MAKYHDYVFDVNARKFIGNFEEMYQRESVDNFDSWHQDDSRQIQRVTSQSVLSQWNFDFILDLGCGKGALTHTFKKRNNVVLGIDISETAVQIATARFPDIHFDCLDLNNLNLVSQLFSKLDLLQKNTNLVFIAECLSYLSNWRQLLRLLSQNIEYLMMVTYLPADPIGFIRSFEELIAEIEQSYEALEIIHFKKSNFLLVFAKSKNL